MSLRTSSCSCDIRAWVPIGVNDAPEAAGEYEFYTQQVLKPIRERDVAGLARQVVDGAHASLWLWAGRPLP